MSQDGARERLQLVLDDETYDLLSSAAAYRRVRTDQLMAELLDVASTRIDELLGPADRNGIQENRHRQRDEA